MKNSIEELKESLTSLGYELYSEQERNRLYRMSGVRVSRKMVLAKITDSIIFFAFDSYGSQANASTTASGLIAPLQSEKEIDFKVYRKNRLLDLFVRRKQRVGIRHIDQKLTIRSKYPISPKMFSISMVDAFEELSGREGRIILEGGQSNNHLFGGLVEGKSLAIKANYWIYKKDDVERMVRLGAKIIDEISAGVNQ